MVYPILILREEIVCLIILVFLAFVSRAYRMGKDGRLFNEMMTLAFAHVILDCITVWTVNHQESVPPALNWIAHALFYLSAALYACEFMIFIVNIFFPDKARKAYLLSVIPIGIYIVLLPTVLKIEYIPLNGTWASSGSAPAVCFGLAFAYLIASLVLLIVKRKQAGTHLKRMLIPMLIVLIGALAVQTAVQEFLFTGGAVTIITVVFFFALENPRAVLERKAMMDALNGIGSRNTYEHDIAVYDEEFKKDPGTPFVFLFADISNLRSVNGMYGHQTGDEYISRMAVLLLNNLRSAEHLYRMGGDEFLAIYRKNDEKTVLRDIRRVHEACAKETGQGYTSELAMGYAVSDARYRSLRDVLRVADYMMYRNKADIKRDLAMASTKTGTHLNLSGLTDRVFDAMCLTSEEYYPYLYNMETGVTRVAPGLVRDFGLEDEFSTDFLTIWEEKVHPEDRKEYVDDVTATLTGKKQYHFCQYRALDKNGEYVKITCRGGVYHGRDGEPDVFAGYMVNHGLPQRIDPDTGLENHAMLHQRLDDALKTGEKAVLMKLEILNINRIKMLYGMENVGTLQRQLADTLLKIVGQQGEIYSNNGTNFMVFLAGDDREQACDIFREIRDRSRKGIHVGEFDVPVDISGGAVLLPDGILKNYQMVRSAAMFAEEEGRANQRHDLNFFTSGEDELAGDEIALLRKVHNDCITDRKHFYLRYQPIVDIQTGEVTGAEALLRWESDQHAEVGPDRFIGFLENDPGYMPLGYDILRQAVSEAKKISRDLPEFNINVNITALQLYEADFIDRVKEILAETGFPAGHLILELTERCKEMDFGILQSRVEALRAEGIHVALDDMGTGFSTLDLLLHLPVDEIKLDYAFTREIRENTMNVLYAKTLCRAAAENGMAVCFEGIEEKETWDYLKTYGKLLGQGFYFDHPLLPEEFETKYCGK